MKFKNIIKTTLASAGILHGINKYIESSSITARNTKNSGKYYHWKHGDIYYKTVGKGTPILLIHDLTVFSSSYEWSKVINKLSAFHTVYCVDLIGCGKSDKPSLTYTNYFYVQLISDFTKDIIGIPTDIAATGLSASFVIMANKLNPNLFKTIFMINPTAINTLKCMPSNYSKLLLKLFETPIISKTLFYLFASKINIENFLTERCFYNPFNLKPSIVKEYYRAAHLGNGNGKYLLSSIYSRYMHADISTALKSVENDIVLITGFHDVNKTEIEESYSDMNGNIIHKTIHKASHLPQLECADEIVSFFKLFK